MIRNFIFNASVILEAEFLLQLSGVKHYVNVGIKLKSLFVGMYETAVTNTCES